MWKQGVPRSLLLRAASLRRRGGEVRQWSFSSFGKSNNGHQERHLSVGGVLLVGAVAIWSQSSNNPPTQCHGSPPSSDPRSLLDRFLNRPSSSQPLTNTKNLPEYTSEQVSQHRREEDRIWMSYGGFVYDVTDFIPLHPGGTDRISRAAGAAMEPFWHLHQQHYDTEEPMAQILQPLLIGRLAPADQAQVDARLEALQQELEAFQLTIHQADGSVTKLSMNHLKHMPKTDITSQVGCPQNQDKKPLSSSLFGGVRLQELLSIGSSQGQEPPPSAIQQLTFHAMDGETVTLPVDDDELLLAGILVCYEMDGAPLTQKRGFPLRVIIPGKRVVKWVQKIEVVRKK